MANSNGENPKLRGQYTKKIARTPALLLASQSKSPKNHLSAPTKPDAENFLGESATSFYIDNMTTICDGLINILSTQQIKVPKQSPVCILGTLTHYVVANFKIQRQLTVQA
ncbi:hypothetical protein BAnh1_02720 [Bartonella australis AUST/NH1]|uniref:Uncharacterized protein n=1 Tax=Bartonella australis (strain Aust/NH1) TaxID=1094489 RepID=M1P2V4_BARAA|nr:hypothetical protein [Bartonella australis]AGF74155.1 hypothetical protein BAnh1_02720 [Bartonella australis AUST/NH1]